MRRTIESQTKVWVGSSDPLHFSICLFKAELVLVIRQATLASTKESRNQVANVGFTNEDLMRFEARFLLRCAHHGLESMYTLQVW